MALYHLSASIVSRGKGQSVAAAAAYISGTKLRDLYTGKHRDWSYRRDVLESEIFLPPDAPSEFKDRQLFVDAINQAEKRCDAQMARAIKIVLPNEISHAEQWELARKFAVENFVKLGFCVDMALHSGELDEHRKPSTIEPVIERLNNPHAHLLIPFRKVDAGGFLKTKDRTMNNRESLYAWREDWANRQNRVYERLGLDVRVSQKSLAAQGINREPTRHLGMATIALEQRGIQTDRGNEYRETLTRNRERELERQMRRERSYGREWERER